MARPKKYQTDEERKAARAAYMKRWYEKNKAERASKNKQYYQYNREAVLEQKKQYRAEHKEERAAYLKKWRADHSDERAAYMKQWHVEHKEERTAYFKEYHSTPFGRAVYLVSGYRRNDKKYNRGQCTITPQWIVDNVFSGQFCVYCGETDWTKLGVDRVDNTKPHTPENCVPCCESCNKKKWRMSDIQWLRKLWSECMLPPREL